MLLGIRLLILIALVLGFFLSWIIGIVAKEEVSVPRSAVVVVLTTIVFIMSVLATADLGLGIMGAFVPLGVTTIAMAGLLKYLAYIPFSKAVIVSSAYSIIMVLLAFWLASLGSK